MYITTSSFPDLSTIATTICSQSRRIRESADVLLHFNSTTLAVAPAATRFNPRLHEPTYPTLTNPPTTYAEFQPHVGTGNKGLLCVESTIILFAAIHLVLAGFMKGRPILHVPARRGGFLKNALLRYVCRFIDVPRIPKKKKKNLRKTPSWRLLWSMAPPLKA